MSVKVASYPASGCARSPPGVVMSRSAARLERSEIE